MKSWPRRLSSSRMTILNWGSVNRPVKDCRSPGNSQTQFEAGRSSAAPPKIGKPNSSATSRVLMASITKVYDRSNRCKFVVCATVRESCVIRQVVAQVSNLLYRRLPVGKAFAVSGTASEFRIHAGKKSPSDFPCALPLISGELYKCAQPVGSFSYAVCC